MGYGSQKLVCKSKEKSTLKFIRKALWPTAIVAAALMLFGALGNAINADTLGNVQSSTGDNVVEAGEEVAIYVAVSVQCGEVRGPTDRCQRRRRHPRLSLALSGLEAVPARLAVEDARLALAKALDGPCRRPMTASTIAAMYVRSSGRRRRQRRATRRSQRSD